MQRLTQKQPGGGYSLGQNQQAEAAERLGRFEDFYLSLLERQGALGDELEALRAAGKKNSARFKEKLGEKLLCSNTLLQLKLHGLE